MSNETRHYLVEIAEALAQVKGLQPFSKRFSHDSKLPRDIQFEMALGFLRQSARNTVEKRLLRRYPKLREESYLYSLRNDLEELLDVVFELDDWELRWLSTDERFSRFTISNFQLRTDEKDENLPIEGSLNSYLIHHWKFRRPVNSLLRKKSPHVSLEHELGEGFKVEDVLADPKSIVRKWDVYCELDELYFHFPSCEHGFLYQLRDVIQREEDPFILDFYPRSHPEFNIKSVLLYILSTIISGNCRCLRSGKDIRHDQHSLWLINYRDLFNEYQPNGPTYEQIKYWMPNYFKPRAKAYLESFLDNGNDVSFREGA